MISWWVMKWVMLYTPSVDFGTAPKDFVNVLEDARIEKMMKRTYPGLRKSFFEGYRELWDQDFFGVKDSDPSDLPLIDRINLYFKGNPGMPFSDEEKVWVTRASNTNTFEEVVALAEELYAYAKAKQEEKEDIQLPPQSEGSGDTPDEYDISSGSETVEEEREWLLKVILRKIIVLIDVLRMQILRLLPTLEVVRYVMKLSH